MNIALFRSLVFFLFIIALRFEILLWCDFISFEFLWNCEKSIDLRLKVTNSWAQQYVVEGEKSACARNSLSTSLHRSVLCSDYLTVCILCSAVRQSTSLMHSTHPNDTGMSRMSRRIKNNRACSHVWYCFPFIASFHLITLLHYLFSMYEKVTWTELAEKLTGILRRT